MSSPLLSGGQLREDVAQPQGLPVFPEQGELTAHVPEMH